MRCPVRFYVMETKKGVARWLRDTAGEYHDNAAGF